MKRTKLIKQTRLLNQSNQPVVTDYVDNSPVYLTRILWVFLHLGVFLAGGIIIFGIHYLLFKFI